MTAWARLLAASQLVAGTAWQLISSPKSGGSGVVVNDGIAVELTNPDWSVEVQMAVVEVELTAPQIVVELAEQSIAVELAAAPIEVEIAP